VALTTPLRVRRRNCRTPVLPSPVPEEITENEQPRTILQRMLDAKISEDRALSYLQTH
jgi:hypothetical protein